MSINDTGSVFKKRNLKEIKIKESKKKAFGKYPTFVVGCLRITPFSDAQVAELRKTVEKKK